MKIRLQGGLLYIPVHLGFRGRDLVLNDVILDTGSAGTVVSADAVLPMGLVPEPHDRLRRIRGVGGVEFVFTKRLDRLAVGKLQAEDFEVEALALGPRCEDFASGSEPCKGRASDRRRLS